MLWQVIIVLQRAMRSCTPWKSFVKLGDLRYKIKFKFKIFILYFPYNFWLNRTWNFKIIHNVIQLANGAHSFSAN